MAEEKSTGPKTRAPAKKKVSTKKKAPAKKVSKKAVPKKKAPRSVSKKATPRKKVTAIQSQRKKTSPKISYKERYEMIATMAYYRAERRGFEPGSELQDWLECEKIVDQMLKNV